MLCWVSYKNLMLLTMKYHFGKQLVGINIGLYSWKRWYFNVAYKLFIIATWANKNLSRKTTYLIFFQTYQAAITLHERHVTGKGMTLHWFFGCEDNRKKSYAVHVHFRKGQFCCWLLHTYMNFISFMTVLSIYQLMTTLYILI